MKILGEKSLSSKVIVGLNTLFITISLIDVIVLSIIVKIIVHTADNIADFILFIMIITTGILALFIIYQFIKIFKNLKNNILFCEDNANRLNIVSNSCLIISLIYLAMSIFIFFIMSHLIGEFSYYIFAFSITLTVIFSVSGIGLKILNEIYKKAIEYKEDHDFTI